MRKCNECNCELIIGETTTEARIKHRSYICLACFNTWRKEWNKKTGYDKRRGVKGKKTSDRLKTSIGCAECGYIKNPLALEWHHVNGKESEYINITGDTVGHYSSQRIADEIAKCVLLCCNCHKILTINEREGIKPQGDE